MWSAELPEGFESDKIAAFVVPYMRGKCLDLGCGMRPVWPSCIAVDNAGMFGQNTKATIKTDIADLSIFSDASCDSVFSSHAIEDFPKEKVPAVLKEWARVLKPGGHLILYVPSANLYPKVGESGANPHHQWNIYPGDLEKLLCEGTDCGWTQRECEERGETNEYSLFEVYQKRSDGKFVKDVWQRNPAGKNRCLVIRYGAIGDQIMVSSILPGLKKQGWHITYNTSPEGQDIIRHDPNVDEWLIQEKDFVPNQQLGPYWETIKSRYDLVLNLCESSEGSLLCLPDRIPATYPVEARRKIFNVNYVERLHDIANVKFEHRPKFHMSQDEAKWGSTIRWAANAPAVMFALNGSAVHKVYPYIHTVIAWLLDKTPAHIYLTADAGIGKELQSGVMSCLIKDGYDVSRIHPMAGKWSVRQALTFAQFCDVVVGPETGVMNAVCMEPNHKVIYLSHSSHENLTKHWRNTTVLTAPKDLCPCTACHLLHYGWDHCHKDEDTGAALCASTIKPERVFDAIMSALKKRMAA